MIISYLLLANAIIISVIAGYFSIIGLTTIFMGAFWPVVAMAASLESSKVVATSWLYRNWDTTNTFIKYYLTGAVVVLSLVTSLGIFGYLSKAHTTQTADASINVVQLKTIEQQLAVEQNRLKILLKQSEQYTTPNRRLENQIQETQNKITKLINQQAPLQVQAAKTQSEIGPLIYVAELVYGEADQTMVSKAVRLITILLVIVFDPLALAMLIAANSSLYKRPSTYTFWDEEKKEGIVEVDKNSITRME